MNGAQNEQQTASGEKASNSMLGGAMSDNKTEHTQDNPDHEAILRSGILEYDLEGEDLDLLEALKHDQNADEDPIVAVVGRPNVGKSTLVNRIVGRRVAVVEDTAGITRDRVQYSAEWNGKTFSVVDTGGWEYDAKGLNRSVAEQAEVAVNMADVILFVLDAHVGATAMDEAMVKFLRRNQKPLLLVANKADDARTDSDVAALWRLGLGEPWAVSAAHGRRMGDLLDEVVAALPQVSQRSLMRESTFGRPTRRVALIGRPNVGKSSLLNRLVGAERAIVHDQAGTTRDPLDEVAELGGRSWCFVDTAGIRRRAHMASGVEFYTSLRTQAALERAEVALVLLAVDAPLSEQDVRVIQLVIDSGRALVLGYNKWDLLDDDRRRYLEREIERDLAHVVWAPRVNLSARTGWHKEKLVPALQQALDSWDMRIPTGRLNAFLAELAAAHPHPLRGGKQPRILFGTQASSRPPHFVLFTTGFLEAGYRRFIVRRLREVFGFAGTPVEVSLRIRERRKKRF